MNTREASEIRALTAVELDQVSGEELPSMTNAVKWAAKKLGVDLDKAADTAKDFGSALWQLIKLPF
jgi:hypothetical protein